MTKFKVLPPTYILSPLNCYSKKRLFEELCLVVSPLSEMHTKDLIYALNEREAFGSTICANEVGMPHTVVESLESSVAVLSILPEPIPYHTIDADYAGVDIAFAFFFSPKDEYERYEEILRLLYDLFKNNDLVNSLRRSWQDPFKLHHILQKIDTIIDSQMQNPVVKQTSMFDTISGILNKLTDTDDKPKEQDSIAEDESSKDGSATASTLAEVGTTKEQLNSLVSEDAVTKAEIKNSLDTNSEQVLNNGQDHTAQANTQEKSSTSSELHEEVKTKDEDNESKSSMLSTIAELLGLGGEEKEKTATENLEPSEDKSAAIKPEHDVTIFDKDGFAINTATLQHNVDVNVSNKAPSSETPLASKDSAPTNDNEQSTLRDVKPSLDVENQSLSNDTNQVADIASTLPDNVIVSNQDMVDTISLNQASSQYQLSTTQETVLANENIQSQMEQAQLNEQNIASQQNKTDELSLNHVEKDSETISANAQQANDNDLIIEQQSQSQQQSALCSEEQIEAKTLNQEATKLAETQSKHSSAATSQTTNYNKIESQSTHQTESNRIFETEIEEDPDIDLSSLTQLSSLEDAAAIIEQEAILKKVAKKSSQAETVEK